MNNKEIIRPFKTTKRIYEQLKLNPNHSHNLKNIIEKCIKLEWYNGVAQWFKV